MKKNKLTSASIDPMVFKVKAKTITTLKKKRYKKYDSVGQTDVSSVLSPGSEEAAASLLGWESSRIPAL